MSGIGKAICGAVGTLLLGFALGPAARGDNPGETLSKRKCAA
jgi:hypothetical protein